MGMAIPFRFTLTGLRRMLEAEFGWFGRLLFKAMLLAFAFAVIGACGTAAWVTIIIPASHLLPTSWQLPRLESPPVHSLVVVVVAACITFVFWIWGVVMTKLVFRSELRRITEKAPEQGQEGPPVPPPSKRDP